MRCTACEARPDVPTWLPWLSVVAVRVGRMSVTLTVIESAIRMAWGPETTFASEEYTARGAGRPARG
jgi:hypothetical protein